MAEQHVRERGTTRLAWVPNLKQRVHVLVRPAEVERTAAHEHQDGWLTQGDDLFQQALLKPGQGKAHLVARCLGVPRVALLPFDLRVEPEAQHDHVGAQGHALRLRKNRRTAEPLVLRARALATLCVPNLRLA